MAKNLPMTYHIARDGTQLGTFGRDDLQLGLANGKFLPTDLAWKEGMTDWLALSVLDLQGPSVPPLPPSLPSIPPLSGMGESCGQATASLVLGLLSCALSCLTAVPAVIFGHIALNKIGKSGGRLTGRGLAITGLVLGYLNIASIPLMFGLAVPAFSGVQAKARQVQMMNDGRQLVLAAKLYASNHGGRYPSSLEQLALSGGISSELRLEQPLINGWKGERGWDYFGAALSEASPSDSVLISSKSKGPRGERVVGYLDGSVMLEDPNPKTPPSSTP